MMKVEAPHCHLSQDLFSAIDNYLALVSGRLRWYGEGLFQSSKHNVIKDIFIFHLLRRLQRFIFSSLNNKPCLVLTRKKMPKRIRLKDICRNGSDCLALGSICFADIHNPLRLSPIPHLIPIIKILIKVIEVINTPTTTERKSNRARLKKCQILFILAAPVINITIISTSKSVED